MYILAVFTALFGHVIASDKPPKKKQKRGPGACEDEEYQKEQRNYRSNATIMLQANLFQCMVAVSVGIKGPLTHYYRWAMKTTKTVNKKRKAAQENEATHFGATLISELVATKAREIYRDII